jgi:hypothetical protein
LVRLKHPRAQEERLNWEVMGERSGDRTSEPLVNRNAVSEDGYVPKLNTDSSLAKRIPWKSKPVRINPMRKQSKDNVSLLVSFLFAVVIPYESPDAMIPSLTEQ